MELSLVCTASYAAIHKAALPSFFFKKKKENKNSEASEGNQVKQVIGKNTKFYHPLL